MNKRDIWCLLGFHKWEHDEAKFLYPTSGDVKKYKVISPCVKCGRIRFIKMKQNGSFRSETEVEENK